MFLNVSIRIFTGNQKSLNHRFEWDHLGFAILGFVIRRRKQMSLVTIILVKKKKEKHILVIKKREKV